VPNRPIQLSLDSRLGAILAVVGLLVVAPVALRGGSFLGSSLLGESFFGTFALDLSQPAALAPALLFAASNALAEELAYRGAMRTWLAPALGMVGANLAQAIVFGLAHSGADFVGPVAPVAASMILVGFIAGVVARRTGSLTLMIAIHAAPTSRSTSSGHAELPDRVGSMPHNEPRTQTHYPGAID